MKRNIICIAIALIVLSISALLIAREPETHNFGWFDSTLNGTPIQVSLNTRRQVDPIQPMSYQELQDNWADHDGKFVRFTGVVTLAWPAPEREQVQRLTLAGFATDVYLLNARSPALPKTYERGQTYRFTGFLIRCETAEPQKKGDVGLRLYAFDIRHIEEQEDAAD